MTLSRNILLIRPRSPNERFGLGPFFRVEPLGLEYVAATLRAHGHRVSIIDQRFSAPIERVVRELRPDLVGISCMHTVDIPTTLAAARAVKSVQRDVPVLVGGHVVSLFQRPFLDPSIDVLALGDAEAGLAEFVRDLLAGALRTVPSGFWLRRSLGATPDCFEQGTTAVEGETGQVQPARDLVEPYRSKYLCVHKQPLWAVETSRGCPYRCNFCSTSLRHQRRLIERDLTHVERDFLDTGGNLFIVDDLFFYPADRSLELAKRLKRLGVRKDWILVQTRLDTVARHPEVVQEWRGLARNIDIFSGFEAPTDAQLLGLTKDMTIHAVETGLEVARRFGYGVTGNFVVDPDWGEAEFHAMWDMVDRLSLTRLGYTILTPLPGTPLFTQLESRIREWDWSKWDMHHLLYEPKLGRQRFFELFVECWRRNVLAGKNALPKLSSWARGLSPTQMLVLVRVLWRTQRMLGVRHYLDEAFPLQVPAHLDRA
ncbi:MAG TPA: radical SAM protein [Polyangiaceae bacterium]|nr:radical SAM protein [Polyangiaceae bacterium]